MKWTEWADERVSELHSENRDRHIRDFTGNGVLLKDRDGRELVSFASNDYFGLTGHPAVIEAVATAARAYGAGSGSARLLAGSRPVHSELERDLAAWKNEEAALLFPSGYTANVGALTAFGTEGATIFSDEFNHASIVDGCRLARADVVVYPHSDLAALRSLLRNAERPIVVRDLVFSMDGDVAPIDGLAELCAEAGALLIVDEAHTALGPHPDLTGVEHLRVGTLSKMLGSAGGFIASSDSLIRLLLNAARSFIFTTAGSPGDAAAAQVALRILQSEEGAELRARLQRLIDLIAPGSNVPIVTIPLRTEAAALEASNALYEAGVLVPAIRPPTVPPGTSRLRISLSAANEDAQVIDLLQALRSGGWLD